MDKDFSHIPIINDGKVPARAAGAFIMSMVVCQCKSDNMPMLIRGCDVGVSCVHCHKMYGIISAKYDREAGDKVPFVEVGQLIGGSTH